MKKILIGLVLLSTTSAFASGGFNCTTKNGKISVSGVIGAGETLLNDIKIRQANSDDVITLEASMKWVDFSKSEVKVASYDAVADIENLRLKVERGSGTLSLDLSNIAGGPGIVLKNAKVVCELE